MNMRPHSDTCLTGKLCSRCYKLEYYREYRKDKPWIAQEAVRKYDANNKDKRLQYRLANKEGYAKRSQKWRQLNPTKVRASVAKYRALKLKATPAWADLKKIEAIYANCPKGYEVDHYYPLQGKNVCGLHVPENLQYLTVTENRAKGNRVVA